MAQSKWNRIEDGYENGAAQVFDNGAGLGSTKDAGRWAVMISGRWISNEDTLAEAKARAEKEQHA